LPLRRLQWLGTSNTRMLLAACHLLTHMVTWKPGRAGSGVLLQRK